MEIVWVVGLVLIMTLGIAFFASGLPVRGMAHAACQHWQKTYVRKYLLLLIGFCAVTVAYGYWLLGLGRDLLGFLLGISYLASITPGDIRERMIPDRTTAAFVIIFAVFVLSGGDRAEIIDAIVGAAAGFVLLGLPYLIRHNSIGMGDVKVLAACGVIYGALGVISLLLRAFAAILIYCIIQLLRRKITLKSEIPFAPFLLLAALV